MANSCDNQLYISGDKEEIERIKEWIGDGSGLLTRIRPIPDELREQGEEWGQDASTLEAATATRLERKYGAATSWDFRMKFWGTKRDVDAQVEVEEDDETSALSVTFESAWVPPYQAIEHLATVLFPEVDVELVFEEPGQNLSGEAWWAEGVLVSQSVGAE